MSTHAKIGAHCSTPIFYVRDFQEALRYYHKTLLFDVRWKWGKPPSFGCVSLGRVEIFFCLRGQGAPGTWLSIFMDDVDEYHERISKKGADIVQAPKDFPWGCREMHVRDPNRHIIRFSQGIPMREPKLEVERVPVHTRIEKRLASLMEDLARHKGFTVGEMLEETLLHTLEKLPGGGVASPHTERTLTLLPALKKKHGINYDVHASYRFVERRRSTRKQKGAS